VSAGCDKAAVGHNEMASRLPFFNEEVDALSLPTIESWVPPAIGETALRLHRMFAAEEKSDGLAALSRLISDPRMKVVWREFYKKKRGKTEEFLHPARVTNASRATICRQRANELRKLSGSPNEIEARLLEDDAATLEKSEDLMPMDPRWSEQDHAAQIFLRRACYAAIDIEPIFLSGIRAKIDELRGASQALRAEEAKLQRLGLGGVAREFLQVADSCDDEARNLRPEPSPSGRRADDPWIISRDRGDPKVRAFVADLLMETERLFGKSLHGTLATTANVVFSRKDITYQRVCDWF
jgi:hypothetical protein